MLFAFYAHKVSKSSSCRLEKSVLPSHLERTLNLKSTFLTILEYSLPIKKHSLDTCYSLTHSPGHQEDAKLVKQSSSVVIYFGISVGTEFLVPVERCSVSVSFSFLRHST